MSMRLLVRLAVAVGLLAAVTVEAQANPEWDPEGKYTGGAPTRGQRNWSFMGGGGGAGPIPRSTVTYPGNHAPGTIVINTSERRLYLVTGNGQAIRYGIGVGRVGFTWAGATRVPAKKEWPDWTPPAQMLRRRPDLPRYMKGGAGQSARRARDVSRLVRSSASTARTSRRRSAQAVSSGCFRMINDDVIDLYNRVRVGAPVIVMRRADVSGRVQRRPGGAERDPGPSARVAKHKIAAR